ncbi:MAG: 3-dehydroquinate synthase [Victivallales bacterium]|jgi:3-dehydroquinate synthase|nr:3-dehydroquinate synthase [Victivallales bacterium]
MDKIRVGLGERAYDIVIGKGASDLAANLTDRANFFVTDSTVAKIWGARAKETMPDAKWFEFPAGESHKTPETVIDICRKAAELRFDRKARFVALGGGVVGDMTGFAAAIYMRGVGFVQIPTTLLAMVDSSVGGKTGVDIPEGKNLIGAFHQPELVLIDPVFLTSLPITEIRCGLSEILKMGVIFDEKLFAELENKPENLTFKPDYERFIPLILRSCELKAQVVAADEREAGVRALLNYGHTFGHAIELLSDFNISHGEGVAIGMCCAGELAVQLGRFSRTDAERQKQAISSLGLGIALPQNCAVPAMLEAMKRDKKNRNGAITLVLPTQIGKAEVVNSVTDSQIASALEAMYA